MQFEFGYSGNILIKRYFQHESDNKLMKIENQVTISGLLLRLMKVDFKLKNKKYK